MLRPEHEALIQGAIDGTLTDEEREAYRQLMASNAEAQNRAAHLEQLTELIESLGQAEAPSGLAAEVIRQLPPSAQREPVRQFVPRTHPRRVAVNKTLIFGLAAAAVVILAVITYTSRTPDSTGTEATIGAAQRAQAPQIAPSDVQLGDAAAQEFLQSEAFEELINDESTRTMLQDTELRRKLADVDLRRALEDDAVRRSLASAELRRLLDDPNLQRNLEDAAAFATFAKKLEDGNVRAAFNNEAFLRALKKADVRAQLKRAEVRMAMARPHYLRASSLRGFSEAMLSPRFAEDMARAEARVQARANVRANDAKKQQ